jgi:hypothetical protein
LIPPTISSARVPLDSQNSVRPSSFAPVVRVRRATLKHVACGRECPAGGAANMRSGSPNSQGECRLKYPASGPVKSVQLEYRYAAGYGCGPPPDHTCENPPTMELWAQTEAGVNAGGPMYTNPKMDAKSGYAPWNGIRFLPVPSWGDTIPCVPCRDAGHWKKEAYSDPVSVDAVCDACEGRYLAFVFHNNDHNVQLLLPITVEIDVEPWVRAARESPPAARSPTRTMPVLLLHVSPQHSLEGMCSYRALY